MSSEPIELNETTKIAAGGAGGMVCGAVVGASVASILSSPSGMVWMLLVLHSGIAMMAMGAWVTPSLLSGNGSDEATSVDEPDTGA